MRIWTMLAGLLLFAACSSSEDTPGSGGERGLQTIRTQFNFSLPLKSSKAATRMGGDVVQENGSEEEFRGIDDVRLLCFNASPTAASSKLGDMIEIKTSVDDVPKEATTNDYSMCQEISIPVGTSYFGFYAHSAALLWGSLLMNRHSSKSVLHAGTFCLMICICSPSALLQSAGQVCYNAGEYEIVSCREGKISIRQRI